MSWKQTDACSWCRCDGAKVYMSDNSKSMVKNWIGIGPNKDRMLKKLRSDRKEWTTSDRKFSSAQAAIKKVNQEFPLQGNLSFELF